MATIDEVAAREAAGAARLKKTGDTTQVPIEKNAQMGYGPKVPGTSSPKVPGPMGKDEDSPDEAPECPTCGGPGSRLGGLGNLVHFRCRDCGHGFSEKAPKKDKKIAERQAKAGAAKKAEIDPVETADERANPKAKLPDDKNSVKVGGDEGSGGLGKADLSAIAHGVTTAAKGTSLAMLRHYATHAVTGATKSLADLRGAATAPAGQHPSSLEAIRGRSRTAPVVKAEKDDKKPDHEFESRKKPSKLESDIRTCKNCGKVHEIKKNCGEMEKAAMGAGAPATPAAPKPPAAAKPAAGVKLPSVKKVGMDPTKPESEKNPPAPRTDKDKMDTHFGPEPKVLHPSDKKKSAKK